ncbi:MAG TPA: DNA-directed RNA polymerase subunit alpha [Bacteroidetes bacterium]|nr:MAG: DNA-directed RNA polymerase subunit alpha [Ignavibacteria bacterium GWA2_54_16]HCA81961.1 DNA-directed RNA polymerase subunit alpha [Bacteroidota bacterium]
MSNALVQMPEKIEIDESSLSPTFGRFTVQPLEKGFGVTLGNSFRRVLLSSLPGTSITAIRVEGIQHEFSTVKGVVEDVADLILNLKQVRIKPINKKLTKVTLAIKGPGELKAKDIQDASSELEVLNPGLHLATLNKEANFELELRLGRGKGYVSSEENKAADQPIGTIAIDSIFTPIKNVRFFVEPTRVGGQTDFEKLILEIETDGSITPDEALTHAGKILRDHIQLFINFEAEPETEKVESEEEAKLSQTRKTLKMSVDELELSVRSHNCLRSANIKTIADLVRKDEAELLKFRNFGRKSLAELSAIVDELGLNFGMDVEKYLKDGNE